jgi:hypothetical protein
LCLERANERRRRRRARTTRRSLLLSSLQTNKHKTTTTARPNILNLKGRAKWDAWEKKKGAFFYRFADAAAPRVSRSRSGSRRQKPKNTNPKHKRLRHVQGGRHEGLRRPGHRDQGQVQADRGQVRERKQGQRITNKRIGAPPARAPVHRFLLLRARSNAPRLPLYFSLSLLLLFCCPRLRACGGTAHARDMIAFLTDR